MPRKMIFLTGRRMRRPRKPRCPRCHSGGYVQRVAQGDGRPEFLCGQCEHRWTSGKDGGEYAAKGP